jgi:tRNA threonylcarbamoyladenosine biosynthesis protein TsaB
LAYALQARVVGINTLEAIAAQAVCEQPRLSVAIDAGRGEVFAGAFERQAVANVAPSSDTFDGPRSGSHEPTILTRWHMVGEPGITAIEEWLSEISSDTALSGPALDRLLPRLPPGTAVVESSQWLPRAATVAALAWQWHLMGRYDDVWKLAPLYLRRSAAEEKWEARHGARG